MLGAIRNIFGDGRDAEMSYYEQPSGAKVFAAGAFTLAGAVWTPEVGRVIENLWARLAEEGTSSAPVGATGDVGSRG